MFRSIYVQEYISSGAYMFRSIYVQEYICLGVYMFRGIYVQEHIYSGAYMFRSIYVQEYICSRDSMNFQHHFHFPAIKIFISIISIPPPPQSALPFL